MRGKLIRILLALTFVLVILSGCSSTTSTPTTSQPAGTTPPGGTTTAPVTTAPVAQGEKLNWKWNSYYASGDLLYEQDTYLAKKIAALTGGRFTFTVYPSGQLTASTEVANSIASGAFNIGSAATPAGTRDFSVTSTMYYHTAQDFQNWWYNGGGVQLGDKIFGEKFKVKFFPCNIISCDSGFRSNKPLVKLEDFKGMKIRCGAIETQDIIKKFGGSAMFLSGNDIYQAAKLGTIDAFEFVGPPTDWTLGFQEVSKYWVYPAWYQTFTAYGISINIDAWKKLPPDFQQAVMTATEAGIIRMQGRTEFQNSIYTKKFLDYGIQTVRISDELFNALRPLAKEEIELSCSMNQNTAAVYDSFFKYQKVANIWKKMCLPWSYGHVIEDKDYPVIKPEWLPDWYKANPNAYDYHVMPADFAAPADWE